MLYRVSDLTRTVTSDSRGCRIVVVRSAMTVAVSSLHSSGDITVGYVDRYSVVDAVIRRFLVVLSDLKVI